MIRVSSGQSSRASEYAPPTGLADLQLRAAEMQTRLALSPRADFTELVSRVTALTGKRITVKAVGSSAWETVTGLLLVRPESAMILIRATDPWWYQFHIVLHEIAHLLFEHPGSHALPGHHPGSQFALPGQTVLARGAAPLSFEGEVDFLDVASVVEAEAENLAHVLSQLVLGTWHTRTERLSA